MLPGRSQRSDNSYVGLLSGSCLTQHPSPLVGTLSTFRWYKTQGWAKARAVYQYSRAFCEAGGSLSCSSFDVLSPKLLLDSKSSLVLPGKTPDPSLTSKPVFKHFAF